MTVADARATWDADDARRRSIQLAVARARALELSQDPDELEAIVRGDEATIFAVIEGGNRSPANGSGLGTRTAADLPYGSPPPQLVGEFLTPEGHTVLYGPGGTGKGITACHLLLRLVRAGRVVMVIDYEGHEREWGSRLRGWAPPKRSWRPSTTAPRSGPTGPLRPVRWPKSRTRSATT